jgi:hypothetical protein
VFAEYKRHPAMLKHHLFPDLSPALVGLLNQAVLNPDPTQRVSVAEFLKLFQTLSGLYSDLTPMDIPTQQQQQQQPQGAKPRYDSAFFSMETNQGAAALSWSDMVEEDYEAACYNNDEEDLAVPHDDDDTDMFVHSDEKESWWL